MIATKDSFEPARVAQAARLSGDATRVAEKFMCRGKSIRVSEFLSAKSN